MNEYLKLLRVQWDRAGAVLATVVGVVALLLGYLGISDTPHVAEQLPYFVSGGLVGLFALGVGIMFWLSADMRDEWRELRAMRQLLEDDLETSGGQRPPRQIFDGGRPADAATADGTNLAGAGADA